MKTKMRHLQATPAPPSTCTEMQIPPDLDQVNLACLAKDPSKRPQCAAESAGRLAAVGIGPAWTTEPARSWWETHRPPSDTYSIKIVSRDVLVTSDRSDRQRSR